MNLFLWQRNKLSATFTVFSNVLIHERNSTVVSVNYFLHLFLSIYKKFNKSILNVLLVVFIYPKNKPLIYTLAAQNFEIINNSLL